MRVATKKGATSPASYSSRLLLRRNFSQPLRVALRLRFVAALAIEARERLQDVGIRRVCRARLQQRCDRSVGASRRLQRDAVDIGKAGVAGIELRRLRELLQ